MIRQAELPKQAVLVLGMHRSGTSAVAAGIEQLGVVMGSSLLHGDEWNPKGYFEEKKIVEFNNRLLDLCGLRWDSNVVPSEQHAQVWAQEQSTGVQLLLELFSGTQVWGFKDPRMCLLGSFWKPVFASQGVSPRLLFVLRDPAEVANSLARRDGIAVKRTAWLWFAHLLGSLEYIEEHSDLCLIDFAALLRDPAMVLGKLASWLDLHPDEQTISAFASEFISPDLSHGSAASDLVLPPLVVRAFKYWRNVAASGEDVKAALGASEWQQIRDTYEDEVRPYLASVMQFFEGDRQLSVMESRLGTLSNALAVTERLAFDRLDQILDLDARLKETNGALAFAEKLALQRQEQVEELGRDNLELKKRADLVDPIEHLATERLAVIEQLDAQVKATADALARAEQCVRSLEVDAASLNSSLQCIVAEHTRKTSQLEGELSSEHAYNIELSQRFRELETLAYERLTEIERLDKQVAVTQEALKCANVVAGERTLSLSSCSSRIEVLEKLALSRHDEVQRLTVQCQASEALALQRLSEIERVTQQCRETERFALERHEEILRLTSQCQEIEQLALQRHAEVERLTLQCREIEALALRRQEELIELESSYQLRQEARERVEQELLERDCALSMGLQRAEYFAFSRLEQIHLLEKELKQTAEALVRTEAMASARLAELETIRRESD